MLSLGCHCVKEVWHVGGVRRAGGRAAGEDRFFAGLAELMDAGERDIQYEGIAAAEVRQVRRGASNPEDLFKG
jgi:hypothetical protein